MKNIPLGPDALRLVAHCPLCDVRDAHPRAHVLSEDGNTRLVHITCRRCGGARLALLQESEAGASTVGVVTDLSHEDVLRFREARRVTTDDVIEAHELLGSLAARLSLPAKKRHSRAKSPVKTKGRARS